MKKKTTKKKNKKIRVVFVCTGNTCRSPVAERVFKQRLKQGGREKEFAVSSCGLSASEGEPMSRLSMQVLREAGYSYKNHRSHLLSAKMIEDTHVFICMTNSHKRAMQGLLHPHVYSIAEIISGNDLSDPYGGTIEDYQRMLDYLVYAMEEIEVFIDKLFLPNHS